MEKHPLDIVLKSLKALGTGLLVIALNGLIFSLFVMWVWNAIIPELLGLKQLGWLEAWGLVFLCGLLFKTFIPLEAQLSYKREG